MLPRSRRFNGRRSSDMFCHDLRTEQIRYNHLTNHVLLEAIYKLKILTIVDCT